MHLGLASRARSCHPHLPTHVRARARARARVVQCSAGAGAETLIPLIQQYVCPLVSNCASLPVGTEDHQLSVLQTFWDLVNVYNVRHGEGYILKSLLYGDMWTAHEISVGFDAMNSGIELIQNCLDRLPASESTGAPA